MKNNIRRLRQRLGLTQEQLGERLGVGWQTISNVERGHTGLSSKKIEAYARALEVDPHDIVSADDGMRRVPVIGHVQAGHFAETWQWEDEDCYEVYVPDEPRLQHYTLRGAETRGPSMNRRYPERTVVIVTDMVETGEDIVVGKRYLVERERADGLREATVKLLWRDDAGKYWLLPESTDPRFQEPIELNGGEDDTIRIVGRVIGAYVRED